MAINDLVLDHTVSHTEAVSLLQKAHGDIQLRVAHRSRPKRRMTTTEIPLQVDVPVPPAKVLEHSNWFDVRENVACLG